MSLNLCFAIDPKKVKTFGKYFGTIDFEVASTSRSQLKIKGKSVPAGKLFIGERTHQLSLNDLDTIIYEICYNEDCIIAGYRYDDLTKHELTMIDETLQSAKQVFFKKYGFGM